MRPQEKKQGSRKKITFTMVPVQEMQAQMLPDFLQSLQQRFLITRRPSGSHADHTMDPDAVHSKDHNARITNEDPSMPYDKSLSDYPHGGIGTPLKGLKNYQWNQKRYATL
jgi:hypothetical protein